MDDGTPDRIPPPDIRGQPLSSMPRYVQDCMELLSDMAVTLEIHKARHAVAEERLESLEMRFLSLCVSLRASGERTIRLAEAFGVDVDAFRAINHRHVFGEPPGAN